MSKNKQKRIPINWDNYKSNPNSFFSRHTFLNFVIRGYSDLLVGINLKEPIEILEFGSGTGYTNKWLCEKFKVKSLTLVDKNKKMLNMARRTLSNTKCKIDYTEVDFFEYNPDKQYDIVHSQGVIEHFEHEKRRTLLKKHYDSTKPGGYCIIYSPTPTKSYRFFRKIGESVHMWPFTDEVPLKEETITKEMKSLGFVPIKSNVFWKYFLTEVGIIFKKPGDI